jgi:hypothetical protein
MAWRLIPLLNPFVLSLPIMFLGQFSSSPLNSVLPTESITIEPGRSIPSFLTSLDLSINTSMRANSRCPLCSFAISTDIDVPDSSENDVILSMAVGSLSNAFPFVRTLRTTGCKASFVLFINTAARQRYNSSVFEVLSDCGVQFLNLDSGLWEKQKADFIRHFVFFEFLMSNRFVVNRVVAADLFDTVFQKDPFTTQFQADPVYYSSEASLIAGDKNNLLWIRPFISQANVLFPGVAVSEEKIGKRVIVCAGLIAGGTGPMIRNFRMMLRCGTPDVVPFGIDQGFLNFALGVGLADFKYQVDPPNETFLATFGVHLNFEPLALGDKFGSMGRRRS